MEPENGKQKIPIKVTSLHCVSQVYTPEKKLAILNPKWFCQALQKFKIIKQQLVQ